MQFGIESADAMQALGARVGAYCSGGEVIELVGDIGAGKTTFVKGLARALGVDDDVQSPTFTISRVYGTSTDVTLVHYDFYRLTDAGVMRAEVHEMVHDSHTVTVIEWAEAVAEVLPDDILTIIIRTKVDEGREVTLRAGGPISKRLMEQLK